MSETTKVVIRILDRSYPLQGVKTEDVEPLKEAAEQLNKLIHQQKERQLGSDKQDLLSMVAFNLLIKNTLIERGDEDVLNQLDNMEALIKDFMNP